MAPHLHESEEPLYLTIANEVSNLLLDGSLLPGDRAPSTNELAAMYGINPATARKGLTILVELGVLEKKRGMGMFVAREGPVLAHEHRVRRFADSLINAMIAEAKHLNMTEKDLIALVHNRWNTKDSGAPRTPPDGSGR